MSAAISLSTSLKQNYRLPVRSIGSFFYIYRYAEDENGIPSIENVETDEEYMAALKHLDSLESEILLGDE